MKSMWTLIAVAGLASSVAGWAAEAPKVKNMAEAESYIKTRTAEVEKEKTAAIAAARTEAEQKTTQKYQPQIADLKKRLAEEQAKKAALEKTLETMAQILKTVPVAPTPPAPARWGQPVFSDDFAETNLSDKWSKKNLKDHPFKIEEGLLTGKEKISMAPTFSGKALRVEYDIFTASKAPCDASLYVEAPDMPTIFAGIGGEMNKQCRISIGKDEVGRKNGAFIQRLRRQHVVIELGEGKARIELDGVPVVEYAGDKAPKILKDVTVSFYTFAPGMNFDNVKVFVIK